MGFVKRTNMMRKKGMGRFLVVVLAVVVATGALCSCASRPEGDVVRASVEEIGEQLDGGMREGASADDEANDERREIVCWGDSMTEGIGAGPAAIVKDGTLFDASYLSYPEILEELTGIKTFNFGVSGATSEEIAYMQGARPFDELLFELDVVDEGVMEQGGEHLGDVLVLEIGSNGGWEDDYAELIKQYREMIAHSGCDDYIIIGDTDDPGTSVADLDQEPFEAGTGAGETAWEAALREEFSDHFVNMRAFLVERGLEVAGLEATEDDEEAAARGCVSEQLRSDWTHLNSYGYYAQATAVFEKGQALGYW